MDFPMQQRIYTYYGNAFEFAFQVPCIIDEIKNEDLIISIQQLLNIGLLLGEHTQKYAKKFREKMKKVNDRLKKTTTLPLFDFIGDELTDE